VFKAKAGMFGFNLEEPNTGGPPRLNAARRPSGAAESGQLPARDVGATHRSEYVITQLGGRKAKAPWELAKEAARRANKNNVLNEIDNPGDGSGRIEPKIRSFQNAARRQFHTIIMQGRCRSALGIDAGAQQYGVGGDMNDLGMCLVMNSSRPKHVGQVANALLGTPAGFGLQDGEANPLAAIEEEIELRKLLGDLDTDLVNRVDSVNTEVHRLFDKLDYDKDGRVEKDDFKSLLCNDFYLLHTQVDEQFNGQADIDKDKFIDVFASASAKVHSDYLAMARLDEMEKDKLDRERNMRKNIAPGTKLKMNLLNAQQTPRRSRLNAVSEDEKSGDVRNSSRKNSPSLGSTTTSGLLSRRNRAASPLAPSTPVRRTSMGPLMDKALLQLQQH